MIALKSLGRRRRADASARTRTMSELLQHLDDSKIAAVIATGATLADIEEALLWAEGESDVLGEAGHSLTGAAVRVFEIITSDESYPEEP